MYQSQFLQDRDPGFSATEGVQPYLKATFCQYLKLKFSPMISTVRVRPRGRDESISRPRDETS